MTKQLHEYDAYLFDWDGTLGRTFDIWLGIIRETLAPYEITADDKVLVRTVFGAARPGLLSLGVPEADLPAIFARWDRASQAAMTTVALYEGVGDMLLALHARGKKVALITASLRPTVEKALAAHSLKELFDTTVTGDETAADKPDPEGILTALDRLSVEKPKAIMLGDSEKDIRAAQRAGIASALFFPPEHHLFHDFNQLQADKPTHIIRSWQALLDAVQ